MVFLPSSILVLLYVFPSTRLVTAQSYTGTYILPNDVTALIPSCAQTCFRSFIQSSFPVNICSSAPSLDCLCSHNSTSGYTVGEGALQCILSEDNVGACQSANATTNTVTEAYNMCFGRANAIANTHATISATFVIESSAPTVVLVATTSTEGSTPNSVTPTTSTSSVDSLVTDSGSPTASISLEITSTSTAQAQAAQSTASASLTSPQIAGIAVGGGTLFILAIGAVILYGCLRRRRILENDTDSDFGTFKEEHGNSMEMVFAAPLEKNHGAFAPGGTPNGIAAKVAPRVPPPPAVSDPNMFSRRSIPTEDIGIAISPESAQGADARSSGRHPSKLLPDKPALTKLALVSPEPSTPEPRRPDYHELPAEDLQMGVTMDERRESGETQFELDISSPVEFSKDPSTFEYGRIYRYELEGPKLLNNWKHGEPSRSMTASTPIAMAPKALDIRKTQSHQSFSQPLQPRTAVSSVYTGRGSLAPSDGGGMPRNRQQPQSYRPLNPYKRDTRDSVGSTTSIESEAEAEPRDLDSRTVLLSPVTESPSGRSPAGRSPVSYPKIKGRLSDDMVKKMEPPKPIIWESPWRQTEIEAAKKRAKQQEQRQPLSRPLHYHDATASGNARQKIQVPTEGTNMPLAQRRGNKLAPAINLDSDAQPWKTESKWRVVKDDPVQNMNPKSPAPWHPMLTPQKVGEDLFLDVRKY